MISLLTTTLFLFRNLLLRHIYLSSLHLRSIFLEIFGGVYPTPIFFDLFFAVFSIKNLRRQRKKKKSFLRSEGNKQRISKNLVNLVFEISQGIFLINLLNSFHFPQFLEGGSGGGTKRHRGYKLNDCDS